MMRTYIMSLALVLATLFSSVAGEAGRVFLPDILPASTIACIVPPSDSDVEREYSGSLFHRLNQLPEMAPFLQSFEESQRRFAADIAQTANVPPQFAAELVDSRLGVALLNLTLDRTGKPFPEFLFTISLRSQPNREMVFAAVMAMLNRPEVVRTVLESQGLDPNLPLKTLAQEETVSGYPPILRIGPNIRIAAFGNMIIFYHGHGSEGIKKVFDAISNSSSSLSATPAFQACYRGADATPGMAFTYLNAPRVMSILDVLNLGQLTRVADTLGLSTVQAVGLAGGYRGEGVRHNLYLHLSGNQPTGLMASLVPMPQDSKVGMEGYSQAIPSMAEAFMATRVDVRTFLQELPYFLDSTGAFSRPGGVGSVLANERILGVPVAEVLMALGGDIVVRPHDDTQVMVFHNVDIPAFESVVARMEQNAGVRFNQLAVGRYSVRYFNRRASLSVPLAPSFCLIPRQQGAKQGILYMASHPQAVVSLIQESAVAREPLASVPDYIKANGGLDGNYSMFYYNNCDGSYRRVYNFLLPVASMWASSSKYPVDTGLLPTASSVTHGFFGCAFGVKHVPGGVVVHAYSPVGANAGLVVLADKLVVSNPLIIGYMYSLMEGVIPAIPTW